MGFFRTFGSHLGAGLASIILDRIAPPPPSIIQQIIDEAPKVLVMLTTIANVARAAVVPVEQTRMAEAVANYEHRKGHPIPHDVINGHVVPAIRADDFPPFKKLGEFTCPKCGGHTWGWTGVNGVDENGTHIRMCTGHVASNNPNVYSVGCNFTWKATDDAKYFSSVEVGPAPESIARETGRSMSDKELDRLAVFILSKFPHEPGRGDPQNGEGAVDVAVRLLDELARYHASGLTAPPDDLDVAVRARRVDGETNRQTAARLLREADAFIAKQAAEIARQADVIKGYKFAVGCGEIQIHDTGTLCLGADGWSLRTDDGSKVTTVPVSAKEAAAFLSTATGTLFEAHAIGSPVGRMAEYAKESAERSAIRNAIATSDESVSCKEYVDRQCPGRELRRRDATVIVVDADESSSRSDLFTCPDCGGHAWRHVRLWGEHADTGRRCSSAWKHRDGVVEPCRRYWFGARDSEFFSAATSAG